MLLEGKGNRMNGSNPSTAQGLRLIAVTTTTTANLNNDLPQASMTVWAFMKERILCVRAWADDIKGRNMHFAIIMHANVTSIQKPVIQFRLNRRMRIFTRRPRWRQCRCKTPAAADSATASIGVRKNHSPASAILRLAILVDFVSWRRVQDQLWRH